MLAQDVSDLIKNQFKESITAQTIQQNVKNGQVRFSLVQRGPKGSIPEIESFVVPGHGDLDIIGYRRIKVPLVRSILYSTTW
jgi:hypothetical protein